MLWIIQFINNKYRFKLQIIGLQYYFITLLFNYYIVFLPYLLRTLNSLSFIIDNTTQFCETPYNREEYIMKILFKVNKLCKTY